jgi:hypothetical protein
LQYQLPGISVLALVAFERNSQETNSDCRDESKSDCRQSPPCNLHELSVDVSLTHHESFYFNEKRNVATKGAGDISDELRTPEGFRKWSAAIRWCFASSNVIAST